MCWVTPDRALGDELYNYLLKHGSLPVEKVQKVFTQLTGAVAYVHAASCVHRDLKLENIMLDKNENVKLCDFGFTREYEGKGNQLQTFCGTVAYSAPEMLKGEKYAGEKVDVWSLGVILYALLCGELPFDEDDDNATKMKILSSEPKWPDHLTPDARSLLGSLLSKRSLLRPSLSEILAHPFLADHAPQQEEFLKIQHLPPFTTPLEIELLERMRSVGVDVEQVMENVLAKRCDALAGWWSLLIEKEQKKQLRKERKRNERDVKNRSSKRLSAASSRLDRLSITLSGVDGEGREIIVADTPRTRGRKVRRSRHDSEDFKDLPDLPIHAFLNPCDVRNQSISVDEDSLRTVSSSRNCSAPHPKEGTIREARSRGSTLQLVTSNHDVFNSRPNGVVSSKSRRKHQRNFINQLANWKHWLINSAKSAASPSKKMYKSSAILKEKSCSSLRGDPDMLISRPPTSRAQTSMSKSSPEPQIRHSVVRLSQSSNSMHQSLSPLPLTPRANFRYSNSGLRGRKSTSSSVSSIRSIHHHHRTQSKASSTSSDCSISTTRASLASRSPHHSVKTLPATPTTSSLPSNIRVVRQTSLLPLNEGPWGNTVTGNFVFAKRKKKVLKGPMMNVSSPTNLTNLSGAHSRSTSQAGRASSEIIQEEDEENHDEVEEVDTFNPATESREEDEKIT